MTKYQYENEWWWKFSCLKFRVWTNKNFMKISVMFFKKY